MADYTQPDVVQKRVRFFDGQFLQDQDFIDEQRYHLDRERRMGMVLGLRGIVTGLTVVKDGADRLTVGAGTAVDGDGRQLVLAADATTLVLPARQFRGKNDVEVRLVHQALPTDVAQTGGESARRWDESPKVVALSPDGVVAVAPDGALPTWEGPSVLLAVVAVGENGDVTVDATGAERAGLGLPGAFGVGTRTPGAPLDIAGSGVGTDIDLLLSGRIRSRSDNGGMWAGTACFVGGDGADRIGFYHGADWRLTVGKDGNVGVGTTAPSARLQVTGRGGSTADVIVNGRVRSANNDGGLEVGDPSRVFGAVGSDRMGLYNGGWRLVVTKSGAVGIGTAEPVNTESWGTLVDAAGTNVNLTVRTPNVEGRVMAHDRGFYGSPTGMVVGTRTTHAVSIATAGVSRLSVDEAGNVGIATGKATPGARLEIGGDGDTSIDLIVNGRIQSKGNEGGLYVAADRFVGGLEKDKIGFLAGGAWRLAVTSDGNVGVGTTTPENGQIWARVLDVLGGTNAKVSVRTGKVDSRVQAHDSGFWGSPAGMVIGTQSGHALSFGTAGVSRMTIIDNGNVGIGTGKAVPGARLEVGGDGDTSEDLLVNGRIRSRAGSDGGLWCAEGRFVGASDDKIGFFHGGGWRLTVDPTGAVGVGGDMGVGGELGVGRTLRVGADLGVAGKTVLGTPSHVVNSSNPVKLHVGGTAWVDDNTWVRGNLYFWWGPERQFMRVENWAATHAGDPSDARLKTAVRPITGAVDLVSRLDGVLFRWSDAGVEHLTRDAAGSVSAGPGATAEENAAASEAERRRAVDRLAGEQIGLIAQNVESVAPSLVSTDADGYRRIRYGHLTALLVEAVKEQRATIARLESRLDDLSHGEET